MLRREWLVDALYLRTDMSLLKDLAESHAISHSSNRALCGTLSLILLAPSS